LKPFADDSIGNFESGTVSAQTSETKKEPQMSSDPEKRTPAETEQMARDVMRRMLETPPQTHEDVPKKRAKKKSKSRRK
jgi:hypothetical protein